MGISDVRDAFNAIVVPMYSCTQAYQRYVREAGTELQVLEFHGVSADGTPFEVTSQRHRPSDDPNAIATETATQFLNPGGTS